MPGLREARGSAREEADSVRLEGSQGERRAGHLSSCPCPVKAHKAGQAAGCRSWRHLGLHFSEGKRPQFPAHVNFAVDLQCSEGIECTFTEFNALALSYIEARAREPRFPANVKFAVDLQWSEGIGYTFTEFNTRNLSSVGKKTAVSD